MAKEKIKCENCGFEEELSAEQMKERKDAGTDSKCSACGTEIKADKKASADKGSKGDDAKDKAKQAAGAAKEQFKKALAESMANPVFLASMLELVTKKLSSLFSTDVLNKSSSGAITVGQYTLLISAVYSVVMGIMLSIRAVSFYPVLLAIAFALLIIVAQYAVSRGMKLNEKIIDNNPSKMSSPAIPDLLSLLGLVASFIGVIVVIAGIFSLHIMTISIGAALVIIGVTYAIVLCKAESDLNIQVDENLSLTEQLLGLVEMNAKAAVKLVPLWFGLATPAIAVGVGAMALQGLVNPMSLLANAEMTGMMFGIFLALAFLPVLIYVNTIFTYALLSLVRSVLSLKK